MTLTTVCSRCKRIRPCPCQAKHQQRQAASAKQRRADNNVRLGRNTQHWKRLRERRLELVGGFCQLGYVGCSGVAETVHLVNGGDHATATLEQTLAACRHCHGIHDGGRARRFF